MSDIIKIIKDSRGSGLNDNAVLDQVKKMLPEKRETFQEVQKRGASATQILDKIIKDNESQESDIARDLNILDLIIKKRKDFLKDEEILKEVVVLLPEKRETFQEVQKRGASATQILDKIILDNKKEGIKLKQDEAKPRSVEKSSEKEDIKREDVPEELQKKSLKKTIAKVKGTRFFTEFFSITRYLLVGIDISDHSVEILLLDKDGTITSYGRDILKDGVIYNGEILKQKELSEALKVALRNTKPAPLDVPEHTMKKKRVTLKKKNHKAIVSLPESKTYVHLFEFENKDNLYGKIEEKIKSTIPFDYEDLYWDFNEIPSDGKKVKILCVAAQRDIVDSYIYFFKSANVDPVVFDIQGASIGRALLPTKKVREGKRKKEARDVMADGKSRMIVDFGSKTTTLNVFNEDAVLSISVPLPYAGNYFTKKIAEDKNVDEERANEIKEREGFTKESSVYDVLNKCGKKIVEEIESATLYYKREFGSEIKEIIVTGGTSLLPGFVEFLEENIPGMSVKKGDSLKKVSDLDLIKERDSFFYANVVGLGLRSLLKDPIKEGINLLPEEIKNQERRSQVEKHRSVLLVALFIAIAGVMFLGLAAYYLIYLPVPAPIQPLKQRVLLQLDGGDSQVMDVVIIKNELDEEPVVRRGPGREQEVIGEVVPGETYQATAQLAGWIRIKMGDIEGWIYGEIVEKIETVDTNIEPTAEGVVEDDDIEQSDED